MKALAPRLQVLANVIGGALLFWLAAPLLVIGRWHPFDSVAARSAGLVAIGAALLLGRQLLHQLRRRRNRRLLEQLRGSDPAAADALRERFDNAMQMLRGGTDAADASAWRGWWRGRRQLYQLPWYVFIGAPGAGKTTALLRSGLKFPLAERLGEAPVAGIGGTRQCDWWFGDRAVFIDTAGRYTTQDSHGFDDAGEWREFMRLLRRYRPVQPINGVVVSVSVPDLLNGGAELERQADAVDARLRELRAVLDLSFPVYLMATKADLLAGFDEFFGQLDAAQREQVWGVTFDYPPAPGSAALPADHEGRLAALASRIRRLIPERLQQEPLAQRRAAIYHFDAQVELLVPALAAFARRALRGTADPAVQAVRGIYLSSGTQEGNPIDRVIGELSRAWGLALKPLARERGGGKAFFLAALLRDLVIAEAALAGTNLQRQRWLRRGTAVAAATVAGALVLACGAWWASYRRNADYVEAVRARVAQATQAIDPQRARDLDQLLPLYALLRNLAADRGVDPTRAPLGLGFGLFQGPRLAQSADRSYHQLLDQTLGPLLAERLLGALRRETDTAARYDALRIYLSLVTPGRLQRDEVRRWAATSAAAPDAGGRPAVGAGEQPEWLGHLDALLERNAVLEAVRVDQATVLAARTALREIPLAQRIHDRLLRRMQESAGGAHGLAELAGPAAPLVLVADVGPGASAAIGAPYTREAWHSRIEPTIDATITQLADEAVWVLGETGPSIERLSRDPAVRDDLAAQVGRLHAQAVIVQWDALLKGLRLRLPGDADGLARLAAQLGGPESPLRQLLRRLATEFPAKSRAAPKASAGGATSAFDATLRTKYSSLVEYATSGASGVDRLLAALAAFARDSSTISAADLSRDLRTEAARAPLPLRQLWESLAEALLTLPPRSPAAPADGGTIGDLTTACRELISERFPFAPEARRDMPAADFARLFGPQGLLDEFFRAHVATQVDTRSRPWRLAGESADARTKSLRSFEMADDIRRLFFPAGARLPQLQLRLTPVAMDSELLQFSIDVDGQLLRYENGPSRPKALQWPGPGATERVLMRILPPGPSNVASVSHEGPWALLRALPSSSWQPGAAGAAPRVRLQVDGRSLALEVATDAKVTPSLIAELSQFRCPEAW